jgi:hypothetical protein
MAADDLRLDLGPSFGVVQPHSARAVCSSMYSEKLRWRLLTKAEAAPDYL